MANPWISAAFSQVPAPTKAPAAAPAAPAVLLPGVLEEATRQRSRWQPLFRDPSFGGSIAKSQAGVDEMS